MRVRRLPEVVAVALLLSLVFRGVACAKEDTVFDDTNTFFLIASNCVGGTFQGTHYRVTTEVRSVSLSHEAGPPDLLTVDGAWYRDDQHICNLHDIGLGLPTCFDSDTFMDYMGGVTYEVFSVHTATWGEAEVYLETYTTHEWDAPAVPGERSSLESPRTRDCLLDKYATALGTTAVSVVWDVIEGKTGMDEAKCKSLASILLKQVLPSMHRPGDWMPAALETGPDSMQILICRPDDSVDALDLRWVSEAWIILR